MTGLIRSRILRPDGTEAARGPLRADLVAEVVQREGVLWHILETRGWRLEPVGQAS